ncbi:phage tail protein [Spongiivirga citrea]|uniref:Phage tail protein n=1 Tax=Spongiivirga citrea TaxID=1481457 RepID=A0A6M0CL71_9FLAO|nr:phage tail protein [Spongiivirga citrea]NER16599.1 phage tail protein [Spongiivirga citrea]
MNNLPLVNFHFSVEWGGSRIGFSEVSGLDFETEVIEYRDGSDPFFSTRKIPGLQKYSNVILKRGVFKGDNEFFEWYKTIQLNTVERRDIIIKLLNEQHEPTIIWKLKSAWPIRIESPLLNSTNCEVAIETLEIVHEGIQIEHV